MSEPTVPEHKRSYGCTFGCGNPYDVIVIQVADGSTEFLCTPCFVRLSLDMVKAITSPDDPEVREATMWAGALGFDAVEGPAPKPRGKNAPATADDDDVLAAFDSVVTVDDLPDEFR